MLVKLLSHFRRPNTRILRYYTIIKKSQGVDDILFVHGGASNFEDELKEAKMTGVKEAVREAFDVLQNTGNVLDSVEKAVRIMEDNEVFNAGRGSVLNEDGHVEMDACIMLGSDLSAGGVTALKDVRNPIEVARKVMDKSSYVVLGGEGAFLFAKNIGLELAMPGGLVTKRARKRHKNNTIFDQKELGTVGAIGLCKHGHTAAATSSGGLNRKKAGRVGHACRPGCGIMADDILGAIAATGHGESISTMCLASAIAKALEDGATASEAIRDNLKLMRHVLHNNGGGIVITKQGELGIYYTTKRMPYAYIRKGKLVYGGVEKNDEVSEDL